MSKMRQLMDAIGTAWSTRIARIVDGARAADTRSPGTGRSYAEGYRAGYWDGVNDTVRAAGQVDGPPTLRSITAEA